MNKLRSYYPAIISAIGMWLIIAIIYPYYCYYVDPDGTAYLTISSKYATGEIQRAINGYWSPWGCWLASLLIRMGQGAILSGVVVNTLAATGYLLISQSLFLKQKVRGSLQWLMNAVLAFFLCYAVFWQSFDDLWECLFLLASLRLLLDAEITNKPSLWIFNGALGALAYFSKAYAMPFFVLNTACCAWFVSSGRRMLWLKITATSAGVMLLLSTPWILALHHKYGIWTTSTSGLLNTSWYLVGHPHWRQGIDLLIPPAYQDSPYYWEDPFFANGDAPHAWSSMHLLGLQALRVIQNFWKLFVSMLQLSVFFPVVSFVLFRFAINRSARKTTDPAFLVALSFLLFPAGYLLVNFEARYLWYMLPLGMLAGVLFYQNHLSAGRSVFIGKVFIGFFAASFLLYPTWCMKKMFREGEREYTLSVALQKEGVRGPFASDALPGPPVQHMERIAYFSGNTFYSLSRQDYRIADLLREMRRYRVHYFFCTRPAYADSVADESGKPYPVVMNDCENGLKIFVITP